MLAVCKNIFYYQEVTNYFGCITVAVASYIWLQLGKLQSKRREELQRLRDLVCGAENDQAILLETPWKDYFKRCLEWTSGDGQTASLSDIKKRYNEAQQRVR